MHSVFFTLSKSERIKKMWKYLLWLFSPVVLCDIFGNKPGHDAVLIRDVNVITLQDGRMTTGRRSSPVGQLICLSGCDRYRVSSAMCRNMGFDGNDVNWKCEADFPSGLKFGQTTVSCEGYRNPNDEYILAGSCGLEYTILGNSNSNSYYDSNSYGNNYQGNSYQGNSYSYGGNSYTGTSSFIANIISWITKSFFMIIVVCIIFYCMCCRSSSNYRNGGGGGDEPGVPPRPPGYPRNQSYQQPGAPPPNTDAGSSSSSSSGGGFFSGAGLGALAGYMLGRNSGTGYYNNGYNNGYANTGGWGNTGWGWGNAGGWGNGGGWGNNAPRSSSWGTSSSYSAPSSTCIC